MALSNLHTLSVSQYATLRLALLTQFEGSKPLPYYDSVALTHPTVEIGFNLDDQSVRRRVFIGMGIPLSTWPALEAVIRSTSIRSLPPGTGIGHRDTELQHGIGAGPWIRGCSRWGRTFIERFVSAFYFKSADEPTNPWPGTRSRHECFPSVLAVGFRIPIYIRSHRKRMNLRLERLLAPLCAALAMSMATNVSIAADDPCITQRNTQEINACSKQTFDQAEQELNSTYKEVLRMLHQPDGLGRSQGMERSTLIKAQRHWVQFRESNCYVVLLMNADGTVRASQHLGCMEELAKQREAQLRKWFLPK